MSPTEKFLLIILMILCSIMPPLAYFLFSDVPTMSSMEAKALLLRKPLGTLLLDVREKPEFDHIHVQDSVNLPYNNFLQQNVNADLTKSMQGKTVLVLSTSGIASVRVTKALRKDHINAFNIKGGLSRWIADLGKTPVSITSLKIGSVEGAFSPVHIAPSHEQWLAVLTGYGIKPLYTLISFILIIILWKKPEIEMKALKYAMIFFFLGENFCAANYLFFQHESYLFEYFHSLGMVLCFGFVVYALFEGMDKYVFHYIDRRKRCALLGLCVRCIKYEEVPCALKRTFIFLSFSASAVALMPLFAELKMVSYNTNIWGTFYNYSHPLLYQIFEIRYCPIIASAAFVLTAILYLLKKTDPSMLAKIFFAGACGAAGFSFLRFVLFHGFQDNLVWMEFWEEITEFVFIVGVTFFLWLFRHTLLKRPIEV